MSDKQQALEALAAAQWKLALRLHGHDDGDLLRLHPARRLRQAAARHGCSCPGLSLGILLGALVIVARLGPDLDLRALGQPPLRRAPSTRAPGASADDASARRAERRRDRLLLRLHRADARHHLVGGAPHAQHRALLRRRPQRSPAFQNGLALAGDYMSAASFLGIAGLVALSGFDGLIYSIGWLVGWPVVHVPDRRAAAQPRHVHVRRRRRVPPAPDAGAHRRGDRHARGRRRST